nr:MAG TPA: hypothetical protein [Bacteriophage sp.]
MEEEPSSGFIALGRGTVDVRGVEPLSRQIISYTLYISCKCSDDQSEHSI